MKLLILRFLVLLLPPYHLGPNILLSILFPNTLNTYSSLGMKDEVSHTYKTKGKVTLLVRNN
jgi:hypothetical protein